MIKASVILGAAFGISWLMRRRPAAERHIVWTTAIVAAAMLPALTPVLPSWHPDLPEQLISKLPSASAAVANPHSSGVGAITFHVAGIDTSVIGRIWRALWVAGSVASLLLIGIGVVNQMRLARGSIELHDSTIITVAGDIARRVRYAGPIHLRRSQDEVMPMTWGFLRPQILLPASVDDWPEDRKRFVITHELGHVKRWDWLFHTIAQIACALYWFNPLFWIARNRLYRESEHACDDIVVGAGADAVEYASHLLTIARMLRRSDSPWSTTFAMARRSTLEERFASLLKPTLDRRAVTRRTVVFIAIGTLLVVVPLAAMRISEDRADANSDVASPQVEQYSSPPLYSDEARTRGIEGIVTVEVRIGADGTPSRLQVVKGLGYGLDENALVAVRNWRFRPAQRLGEPIEATTQIDVEFSLRNAELNDLIANEMATRIGPEVIPPQIIRRVDPQALPAKKQRTVAGDVILDTVILEDGTPKIVRVIHSLDWELDETAINALKQWKFSPAMKDGRPVKVRMDIALRFQRNSD